MHVLKVGLSLACALIVLPAIAAPLGTNGSVIDDARWNARLLLMCGKEDAALGSPLQKAQFEIADWASYAEREITVVGVSLGTSIIFDTASFAAGGDGVNVHIWNDGDPELEQKADCLEGKPSLTLIGKDGGVKARWDSAVFNEALFAIIDAMPMRQSEMRRQKTD